jgi:hypothetical protein
MNASRMVTCRFCKQTNYDYDHPNTKSGWLKYGVRHHAHLSCLFKAKGLQFLLANLRTWELEMLPAMELDHLGILKQIMTEVKRRKLMHPQAQVGYNV